MLELVQAKKQDMNTTSPKTSKRMKTTEKISSVMVTESARMKLKELSFRAQSEGKPEKTARDIVVRLVESEYKKVFG